MMQSATAIQLPFWQDPQSPLAVALCKGSCQVFFGIWDEAGDEIADSLGKITFRCWATRTVGMDLLPYSTNEHTFHSFVLEVPNSPWLSALSQTRLNIYPKWKDWDKSIYHHYVVVGADSYLEVLAEGFTAELATAEELQRYSFLHE
jgi:hypothetical protein